MAASRNLVQLTVLVCAWGCAHQAPPPPAAPADWLPDGAAEWERIRARYGETESVLASEAWAISHAGEGDDGKALEALVDTLRQALGKNQPALLEPLGGTRGVKERLVRFLASPYDLVRGVAAVTLGVIGDPHAIPPVVHLLGEAPEPPPQGASGVPSTSHGRAAIGLGLLGATDQADRLADILQHSDGFDAMGAAIGLGRLRAKKYAKTMAGVLRRTWSDELQQAIIGALADMDATDCADEIAAAIFREEAGVETREAGLYALVALKAEGQESRIAELLLHGDRSAGTAAKALAAMGARRYGKEIAALLDDREPGVRHAGALALGLLGDPSYAPSLAKLLDAPEDYVRYYAAFSLVLLGARQYAPKMLPIIDDFHARGYGLNPSDGLPLDAAGYRALRERFLRGVEEMRTSTSDAGAP